MTRADLPRALRVLEAHRESIGFDRVVGDSNVAKISVIGVGMRSHAGVAHAMFSALGERGISIDSITTSEIKISVLIPSDATELAVRALHAAYELDAG